MKTCTLAMCQLWKGFCTVSSASGMQTPLFPLTEWGKKITNAQSQHIKRDKLQWKTMKKYEDGTAGWPPLIFGDCW